MGRVIQELAGLTEAEILHDFQTKPYEETRLHRFFSQEASFETLVKILRQETYSYKSRAGEALVRFGEQAIPAFIELLESGDTVTQRVAAYTLGEIGQAAKSATPALLRALSHEHFTVRLDAATTLQKISPKLKAAVPYLIERLKAETMWLVRSEFIRLIAQAGYAAKAAIPYLEDDFNGAYMSTRRAAFIALTQIEPDEGKSVAFFLEGLSKPETAAISAMALGKMGARAKTALEALAQATHDLDRSVRDEARTAIRKIKNHLPS